MTTLKQLRGRLVRTVLSVQTARMRRVMAVPRLSTAETAETAELPRAFASSACIAHNILAPRQIIQRDC